MFGMNMQESIPKSFEFAWGQLCVAHRMRNRYVPEIILNGAGINTFIGQIIAAGMSQHMWMDGSKGNRGRTSVKI